MERYELVHPWHRCHGCSAAPITGNRFDCQTCPAGPDNHLCEQCYDKFALGAIRHPVPGSYADRGETGNHEFVQAAGVDVSSMDVWAVAGDVTSVAPPIPSHFLLRPEFVAVDGQVSYGGFGFAAQVKTRVLILTALHLLDEVIKRSMIDCSAKNALYSGHELGACVRETRFYDALAARWPMAHLATSTSIVAFANARLGDDEPDSHRDIAAFCVKEGTRVNPQSLAPCVPEVGQPVWVIAVAPESKRKQWGAVVVESTAKKFIFRFSRDVDLPKYSSGAPVVDRNGNIVGINAGYGRLAGRSYGHANHVGSIRCHLAGVKLV
jgi:hypothetical protein